MAELVCPWWIGYLMASPLRRLVVDPEKVLAPYVAEGMTVLEPGPGMGFFSIPVATMVGADGRIVAVDVQRKMLDGLRRRAAKAGLLPRIEMRLAEPETMGVADLRDAVDLVLAIAVVHEMPSVERFFGEATVTLKPNGSLLLVEPAGHVDAALWQREREAACAAGLETVAIPCFRNCHAALLRKGA